MNTANIPMQTNIALDISQWKI